jgi:Flp pilus assembly protein TadD
MNAKKQKEKERRRARKLAEEAWEAANDGNLDLAEKIIRRAVATQMENPVLWNDQGVLLSLRQKEMEAEEAFRAALSLAPDYAEPLAGLAAIRFRQGNLRDAVALQSKAVEYAPQSVELVRALENYQTIAGQNSDQRQGQAVPKPRTDNLISKEATFRPQLPTPVLNRLADTDWQKLADELTRTGCVLFPRLLDEATCREISAMFDAD